jgi:myosin protein heavy chain
MRVQYRQTPFTNDTPAYIRSLEKSKTRLTGEAEDLARQTKWECVELRAKEKAAKAQQERTAKAIVDIMKERRAKEAAELTSRKLRFDLQTSRPRRAKLLMSLSS